MSLARSEDRGPWSELSAKKKVLETLSQLPPDATVEEAMEQLYFLAKIERGVEQADSGRTISHDEVKREEIAEYGSLLRLRDLG